MCIRLVCIPHRLRDSGPAWQAGAFFRLRCLWELRRKRDARGEFWRRADFTLPRLNLCAGSAWRLAEAAATGPGTNSIRDSWLAGEWRPQEVMRTGKKKGEKMAESRINWRHCLRHLLDTHLTGGNDPVTEPGLVIYLFFFAWNIFFCALE